MRIFYATVRVKKFVDSIDKSFEARVLRLLDLASSLGSEIGMPHSKPIGRGLFELRIKGAMHIRLLYGFKFGLLIIVHGFIKKTEQIPKKEIEYARKILNSLSL